VGESSLSITLPHCTLTLHSIHPTYHIFSNHSRWSPFGDVKFCVMPRAKYWCFTSYSDAPPAWDATRLLYLTYQRERCPSSGRLHYQGYAAFLRASKLSDVKAALGNVHLEPANSAKAIEYCHKEESRVDPPVEFGTKPTHENSGQGRRSDLLQVASAVVDGATGSEIARSHPDTFIRYSSGILRLISTRAGPRDRTLSTRVIVYHGPPGSGKTRCAFDNYPGLYEKSISDRWWCGYEGQDEVLLDDFGEYVHGGPPVTYWLRVLDRYPLRVENKGGSVQLQAHTFIITSNYKPEYFFEGNISPVHLQALMRRITEVRDFEADPYDPVPFLPPSP